MRTHFTDLLGKSLLLIDGAMGTELYEKGFFVSRNYDLLNIDAPEAVAAIHNAYLESGAQIIETNTFGANRNFLTRSGAQERVREINLKGAAIARECAGEERYVAGAIGPCGLTPPPLGKTPREEILEIYKEQAGALIEGGVDLIFLESFRTTEDATIAVEAIRQLSKEIVIGVSFVFSRERGGSWFGLNPETAAAAANILPIQFLGANCAGPKEILDAIVEYKKYTRLPLLAMPNAGLPELREGRMFYMANPEYFAEFSMRYADLGVSVIGGCCGTSPAIIDKMHHYLKSRLVTIHAEQNLKPAISSSVVVLPSIPLHERSGFGKNLGRKFQVSVELALPKGLSPEKQIDGAKFLYDNGIDIVNIPDGPRAMARTSPISLATLIKQKTGLEAIIHYCCRDRNLLGMQMDLIGAAMLGLNNLLIITGDPPKMGNAPNASAVFDTDSIGLTKLASNLNKGLDIANNSLGDVTRFLLGVGCNPGTENLEREIERFRLKIEAGAEYVFSQPVYDSNLITQFLDKCDEKNIYGEAWEKPFPFFPGILPLASMKNALFLHNEVPGMQIPAPILARMEKAITKEDQRAVGIDIAREALREIKADKRITGVYICPPFGNYQSVLEIVKGIL